MRKTLLFLFAAILLQPLRAQQRILLSEQSQHRVAIADVSTQQIVWEWKPALSNVQPEHVKWFNNPSDAKLVRNGHYILTCASGGGVALVRMADKKTVFYAYAGGNPHSPELLPDGNIVVASSTANYLTIFRTDTLHFPDNVYSKRLPIAFGHNVVWDHQRQLLWTAAMDSMKTYRYNFNTARPDLIPVAAVALPGTEAHDLFPVYEQDALWLTNTTHVYRFSPESRQVTPVATRYQEHIKSVSSGPAGYPVIIIKPKESWWTDEVIDLEGKRVFYGQGLKIYKARWMLDNSLNRD